MAQQSIEYGKRNGPEWGIFIYPVAASQVFKKAGGNFVSDDTSGRVQLSVAGDRNVVGHALPNENWTSSSTAGGNDIPVDTSFESTYEVPINNGTYAATNLLKVCDISVVAGIQGANLLAATQKILWIVGKGTTNAAGTVVSVLVQRNQVQFNPTTIV